MQGYNALMTMLSDSFGRKFYYLRLSLTATCNFKCQYCLPHGMAKAAHNFLNILEIENLLSAFARLGINKVRLTGGEPTLRKDFVDIAKLLKKFPSITHRVFTTNGYNLKKNAQIWYNTGLTGVNVSLDSLQADQFYKITGRNLHATVISGIEAAIDAGFKHVKINVVLLKGLNLDEFEDFVAWIKHKPLKIRFIELMQTNNNYQYFIKHYFSPTPLIKQLLANGWDKQPTKLATDGPAIEYKHPDYKGSIGFISPYAKNFCASCNRLRVSAAGDLYPCLFGGTTYNLRSLLQDSSQQDQLIEFIINKLALKSASHDLHHYNPGITNNLASIGG